MYATRFQVRGSLNFPLDMLRYDRCSPSRPEDVMEIATTTTAPRTVELVHYDKNRFWEPTAARWRSFGWEVVDWPITETKVP